MQTMQSALIYAGYLSVAARHVVVQGWAVLVESLLTSLFPLHRRRTHATDGARMRRTVQASRSGCSSDLEPNLFIKFQKQPNKNDISLNNYSDCSKPRACQLSPCLAGATSRLGATAAVKRATRECSTLTSSCRRRSDLWPYAAIMAMTTNSASTK